MSSSNTAPASAANDDPRDSAPRPVDQNQLSVDELAELVLMREFRPRVASVRRLAEAVLARKEAAKLGEADRKNKKKKKKAEGKKRKLARIPGQKGKKKA